MGLFGLICYPALTGFVFTGNIATVTGIVTSMRYEKLGKFFIGCTASGKAIYDSKNTSDTVFKNAWAISAASSLAGSSLGGTGGWMIGSSIRVGIFTFGALLAIFSRKMS